MARLFELALDKRNTGPTFFVQNTDPVTADAAYVRAGTPWIQTENDTDPWGLVLAFKVRNAADSAWITVSTGATAPPSGAAGGALTGTYPNPTLASTALTLLGAVTPAANKGVLFTSTSSAVTFDLTAFALTLLDDTTAGGARATLQQTTGTGSPESVVTATPGAYYVQTDASSGAGLWYKKTGTAATGWELTTGTSTGGSTMSVSTQTASYTLSIGDANNWVRMDATAALNLTVPASATVAFSIGTQIHIEQKGAGQVTIVAGGGVTIRTPETLKLAKQYATGTLVKVAADEWVLAGYLEV